MSNTSNNKRLDVELDDITKLIELLKSSGINEIEITQGETAIRLRKDPEPQVSQVVAAPGAQASASQPMQPADQEASNPDKGKMNGHAAGEMMKSPMVGTFYTAPAPDASPYVNVGDRVKKGQTVCIIEAMKTMNQIEAEQDGILQDILVHDAQPVEFGEPLFVIQ